MECVQIGNAKLYHGDCREVSVDACVLLTDPPYGTKRILRGAGKWSRHYGSGPPDWDELVPGLEKYVSGFEKAVVWGGHYYMFPPSRGWLIWDKKQNDKFTSGQAEMAWTSVDQPIRIFRFSQVELINEGEKVHPTQKPVRLMEWCLDKVKATPSDTVVDPYMGSGTTGVACANAGVPFIGVELVREYFDAACERIDAAQSQGRLAL